VKDSGIAADAIHGVSFSAHGKGLYLVDKQGQPVRNGIVSSDSRTQPLVSRWKSEGRDAEAYGRSLQQLWPSHPAALLGWLKEHEPDSYQRTGYILMVHDYIRYCLTGKFACEKPISPAAICLTSSRGHSTLLCLTSSVLQRWRRKRRRLIGSAECAGYVTEQAAVRCGLKAGTPVFGGLFDVVGAALASGVHDSSCLSAVAGTRSIATRVSDCIEPSDYPYVWEILHSALSLFMKVVRPRPAASPGLCSSSSRICRTAIASLTSGRKTATKGSQHPVLSVAVRLQLPR
jgi:L-xylulokinase